MVIFIAAGGYLRVTYLWSLTDDPNRVNFGGDPNHHYNIAWNIAHGRGPFTDFIFSFWFRHRALPALTDIYPPGVHYILGFFLTLLGDSYATARWTCLVFGSLVGCVGYFLARQFVGVGFALVVAAVLVLNPVHIEHSTIIMTPVVGSFFVWLAVGIFLRYERAHFVKGILAGWCHLCMSAFVPLSLAYLICELWPVLRRKVTSITLVRSLIAYTIGAVVALGPWAFQTYRYFGKPLYTNFAFYPLTLSWVPMNYSKESPSLHGFAQSVGGTGAVARLYLRQFLDGFGRCYINALPLSTPEGNWMLVLNVGLIGLGLFQLFRTGARKALFFLTFTFCLLLLLSVGSTANEGFLSTRHVLVFAPFVVILWVLGLELVLNQVRVLVEKRLSSPWRRLRWLPATAYLALFLVFLAATRSWTHYFKHWKYYDLAGKPETPLSEIFAFHYFWSRRYPPLEEAAAWIRQHTSENSVFMYGKTPQDFWAITRRRVVIDPVFAGGEPMRAQEEVNYYNVDFLVLDSNNSIYPREPQPVDVAAVYPGLKLTCVWKNGDGSFRIYNIAK